MWLRLSKKGRESHCHPGGLGRPRAIKDAVAKTVSTFGGLDILVNNAGTAIPKAI